jgi:hypothetical protein
LLFVRQRLPLKTVFVARMAVYVAVAEDFEAVLVSWDIEILERCPESMPAMSPEKWLENASRTGERE